MPKRLYERGPSTLAESANRYMTDPKSQPGSMPAAVRQKVKDAVKSTEYAKAMGGPGVTESQRQRATNAYRPTDTPEQHAAVTKQMDKEISARKRATTASKEKFE